METKNTDMDITLEGGLNRTMQYGNKKLFKFEAGKKEFKSYYVVWKLVIPGRTAEGVVVFKSYYVVWKLMQKIQIIQKNIV